MRLAVLGVTLATFSSASVWAAECTVDNLERATLLAQSTATSFVAERFMGGKSITGVVNGCQINEGSLVLNVTFEWRGVLFSGNEYEVRGTLVVGSDEDGEPEMTVTWGNDKVKELEFFGNVFEKVVIVSKSRL